MHSTTDDRLCSDVLLAVVCRLYLHSRKESPNSCRIAHPNDHNFSCLIDYCDFNLPFFLSLSFRILHSLSCPAGSADRLDRWKERNTLKKIN